MDKLVSIILPSYNAEKYLKEALVSLVNQTYKNIEIIAINDNSTDNTVAILENFSSKYNNVIVINNKNKGFGNALNLGIAEAKGEYIARMDGDDICDIYRIEKQMEYILKNPTIDVISCFTKNMNADGSFNSFDTYLSCTQPLSCLFFSLFENPIAHPAVFGKAEIFKLNNYETVNSVTEDYLLWVTLLKKEIKIGNVPKRLLYYRKNLLSYSNLSKDIMQNRHIEISNNMLQFFLNTQIETLHHKIILLRCINIFTAKEAKKAISVFKKITDDFILKFNPDATSKKEILVWQQQRILKIIASGFIKSNIKEKIRFLSLILIYPIIFFQTATYKNIYYRMQWIINSK